MGLSVAQRKAIAFMVLGSNALAISGVALHALPHSSGWDLALLARAFFGLSFALLPSSPEEMRMRAGETLGCGREALPMLLSWPLFTLAFIG